MEIIILTLAIIALAMAATAIGLAVYGFVSEKDQ